MSVTIYNPDGSSALWSSLDSPLYYRECPSPMGTERGVSNTTSGLFSFLYTLSSLYSGLATIRFSPLPNVADGDLLNGDYFAVDASEPPPPSGAMVNVYSNDGTELLGTVVSRMTPSMTYYSIGVFYNDDDKCISNSVIGYPFGNGFDLTDYAGVADTPNATEPTYEDGYNFGNSGTYTVYVVPKGGGDTKTLDVTYNSQKIIDSLEVAPPVTVTYNGSTIATLNEGDTKTLDILGTDNKPKILATPIVIGGKTISDVDALGRKWVLEHNLVVEVGGNANG